jgi:hypothetical protein
MSSPGAQRLGLRSTWVSYEAWNRYVLAAIGLFGVLLYCGLLYVGFAEFRARIPKRNGSKKQSRNRVIARKLRNPKVSGH